ncbi:MAG: GTPase [Planctomycetota bacterium]
MSGAVVWSFESGRFSSGALSVVRVSAPNAPVLDAWLEQTAMAPVRVGDVRLRDLLGVDQGVVARWSDRSVVLTPHGGLAVSRALADALRGSGALPEVAVDPETRYPEASSAIEARMLWALSRAPSPRAVEVLLEQPRWWEGAHAETTPASAAVLRRLLDPPTVAVVGRANVGKSTLLNSLAARDVALVADASGTTRDHVGATVEVDGLVVRWVDTPGVRPDHERDDVELRAAALSDAVVRGADLVLRCGDASAPPPALAEPIDAIDVALRLDLGRPGWAPEAAVSAATGEGLNELALAIRRRLVPDALLERPGAWRFWAS